MTDKIDIGKGLSAMTKPKNLMHITLKGIAVWSGFEAMNTLDSFVAIPPIVELALGTGISYGIHEEMGLGITTHGLAEASARFKAGQSIENIVFGEWLNLAGKK